MERSLKISVVIPAFNEEELIHYCIDAILAADKPSCPLEVIVVNNASTDDTAKVVSSYEHVRLIEEPTKGLTVARQRGADVASGNLLCYIDADTIIPKHLLKYVENKFNREYQLVGISGPYKYHDWNWFGRSILWCYHWLVVPFTQLVVNRILHKGTVFYGGNFTIRKDVLEQIGGFDKNLEFWSEDTQIGRRLSKIGKVRFYHHMYVFTSARRYYQEGMLRVLTRYILNFTWDIFFNRPFTKGYTDIRSNVMPRIARTQESIRPERVKQKSIDIA